MPIIRLEIFEGRPDEMKKELIKRVSEATADVLKVPHRGAEKALGKGRSAVF